MGITKSELTQSIVMVFIVSKYASDLVTNTLGTS